MTQRRRSRATSGKSLRTLRVLLSSIALLAALLPLTAGLQGGGLAVGIQGAAAANPIVTENQQAGTTSWQFSTDSNGDSMEGVNHEIEGYASLTSVNKGSSIGFKVSLSSAAQFTMGIYRMGYYGGAGGRLMQQVGPLAGGKQAACPITTTTTNFGLTECNWTTSYTLTVPTTWTTGNYVVKLRRTDTGREKYMTFVVRDDAGAADIVHTMDVTTWQAYNFWGGSDNGSTGYNLYGRFRDIGGSANYASLSNVRAYAVSFDRPYTVQGENDGAGRFFLWDYPMVRWTESQGYNVTYATSVDIETNPSLLSGRKALINTGHDEYYSDGMRANIQAYINGGAHMGLFSANNFYFRILWGANPASGQSYRRMICYKSSDLDSVTLRWRDLTPPIPENALGGVMLGGLANDRPFRVSDAANWIYAGTGLVNYVSGNPVTSGPGQNAIAGLIGYEFDSRASSDASLAAFVSSEPANTQMVAHSAIPASDNGVASFSDATVYTASSGAIIFSAGTLQWSWGLDNGYNTGACACNPGYLSAKAQQITKNILDKFLTTPTGGGARPTVTLNPTSLTFPGEAVGTTSAAQAVTLTNTGNAPLTLTGIAISGANAGDFAQTNTCPLSPTALAAGASCAISVTFTAGALGARSATLAFTDNAAGSPQGVALAGSGVSAPAVMLSPTSLAFTSQQIGTTSASQMVTLSNGGSAPLTIASIGFSGAAAGDFARTTTCPASPATLVAGGSCTISVAFAPTAAGSRTANLSIADDATGSPHTVALVGTGTATPAPAVSFSPASLTFAAQQTGTTSAAQAVTLTNTGNAALTISSIGLSGGNAGDFAQTNTCPATLAAGANCAINVTFTPLASGSRTTNLSVADNAAGSPHTVALTGTGSATAGQYLLNGFESGNLTDWTKINSTGGTATVQTTTVNSGTYAAALTNNASSQYVALWADLSGPQAQTYTRFCFRLSGLSGSAVLAQGRDVSGNNMWEVDYNAGRRGLDLYFWNGARARSDLYTPVDLVVANLWYCAEIRFNEATAGRAELWLNGVSITAVDANFSATNPYSRLYLWNNGPAGTVYFDDIRVANTAAGPVGAGAGPLPTPAVGFSPTSLTFASQQVGTTSAGQVVTLTNTGSAPLTLSGIAITGANAGDFAQTNTCPLSPTTLAGGGSCTISVTFAPTAGGSRAASLSVTDNAAGSPHAVALAGTGTAAPSPGVGLSPASLTFAAQQTGTTSAAQAVTLTNTGNAALTISSIAITGTNAGDFAQTNTCPATLAAGANCTINVTFAPTAGGARAAGLSVTDNAPGSPHTVALAATGTLVAGTYLTDGFEGGLGGWTTVGTGTATAQTTTVNAGTRAAALANTSGQYTALWADLTGPQAQTYSRFCFRLNGLTASTPLAQGRDANGNNMWEVDYNAGRKGLDMYVWSGSRIRYDLYSATDLVLTDRWYCAEVQINEAASGRAELWLNGVSVAAVNADLAASNPYARLFLHQQVVGTVYFDDVRVASTYGGPVGAGTAPLPIPAASLSPASLTFAAQQTGTTSAAQAVTLTNSGGVALTVSSIAIVGVHAGDFAQTNNCPASLAAGANCTINVTFAPTAGGGRNASLSVADNAAGSPHTVALAGTGNAPAAPVAGLSPTSLSFGSRQVGTTSAAQAVTLGNSGNAALTITNIALTGANAADFAQTNNCPASLAAGANCTINVTFTPVAGGSRAASLSVTSNAAGSPHAVALAGTGTLAAGTYLLDGFEGGIGGWTATGNGAATVQGTTVNSGGQAASLTNANGQYVGIWADLLGGPQAQTYSRFCFRLVGLSGSVVLAQGRDASGAIMWEIDYNAGRRGLDLYAWNGARARSDLYTPADLVVANSWYCAELRFNEATNGRAELWLNGISVAAVDADLSAANPYSRLYLWNNGATGTIVFDDVRVANTAGGPVGAGAGPLPVPAVGLSPTSLTFANQQAGTTSAAQTVTLTNSGGAALAISGITLTGANAGDFAQTNTCPASLAAGANCTISVTFSPGGTGGRSATLSVADNATGSPHTAALAGTGTAAPAPVAGLSPSSLTFASQQVGTTSAVQTVTLTNSGNAALTISSIGLTGANAGDFARTHNCPASLAAGANCAISVTFTPTAGGSRSASVSVADNAAGNPHTVALTGTGATTSGQYLNDGFEAGLGGWTTVGNGGAATQTTTVRTGSNAAALTNASGQYVGLYRDLIGGPQAQTYTRFCFRISNLSGSIVLAQGRDANGANLWEVDYDANRRGLDVYLWSGSRARFDLYTAIDAVQPNTWYCAELRYNEAVAGRGELWLNGVMVDSVDADLSATDRYSRLILWNNGATGTVYFDDIRVANSYIGP